MCRMFHRWPSEALGVTDDGAALDINLKAWALLVEDGAEDEGAAAEVRAMLGI
jgi:hypothetical protein